MARSILWYGPTGSFKTTQNGFLARYVYEKYGKITRILYTGASDGALTRPEEEIGIVESFRLGLRQNPLPMLRLFARGYWPKVVTLNGMRKIQMQEPTAETWEKVGCVILDSLSMAAEEGMRDTVDKGKPMAQDPVTPFVESIDVVNSHGQVTSKDEIFAAPAKAHYGFGQNLGVGIINALSSLPCQIVGFTTMEKKADEEDASGRQTVYGPEMPGKVLTPKVGGLVGDLIHFDQYFVPALVDDIDEATGKPRLDPVTKKSKQATILLPKTRAYFVKHKDVKSGIDFPAKPRLHSSQFPKLLERWPKGYFEPTLQGGLDEYVRFLDDLEAGATEKMKAWREEMDRKLGRISAPPSGPVPEPK